MGREVRRVPADWEHPKDANGYYIPMYERIQYTPSEIKEGILEGWIKDGIPTMPQWPESERTHWQMYETCTEGTPISPVMATPEQLAAWMADTKASACRDFTANYEQWLDTILRGSACSAVWHGGKLESGVQAGI